MPTLAKVVDEKTNAMRRVLEIFTEAGWLSNSALKDDTVLFTPTPEGLDKAPILEKLLTEIFGDQSFNVGSSAMWLCRQIQAADNDLRTDDQEMARIESEEARTSEVKYGPK